MRRIVPGVLHLDAMRISNVFLFDGGPGDRWLVDCGHPLELPVLLAELLLAGLRPRDLTGVVLTHRHSDHAGNARFLQRRGARVAAHERDAAILAGEAPRGMLSRGRGTLIAGIICHIENRFPAAQVHADSRLGDGDRVGGFEIHAATGHTEGSVLLRHEASGCLATGDSLLAAYPPLTVRAGLALAYPSYSVDCARSHDAVVRFHEGPVRYDHLLPGHGRPLCGGARERVVRFLAERTPSATDR